MMHRLMIAAMAASLFLVPSVAHAGGDDVRAIIERAIKAQGGEEQIAKLMKAWRANIKGSKDDVPITGEMVFQYPGQVRIETRMEVNEQKLQVVAGLDGDKAWLSINGQTQDVQGEHLNEMQDGAYRSKRVRFLLALVKEAGFTLSLLDDQAVVKRPAKGIRVQAKGHRDIDLYFDKETGLLVKTESRVLDQAKKELVLEQIHSEYKDFGGLRMATKFTNYENGKLRSIEEITGMKFVDRIDDREFAKP
jgi:hypothetical protein